jgi:hypothetical protein
MSLVTFPNVFQLKINNTDHTSIAIVAILVVSWVYIDCSNTLYGRVLSGTKQ